ncbi:hypothetical protein RJ640_008748 [Escallonia rubra]|uniref:Pentatricopeptide repeat-containing protein n=1 Tax=Escallonia rubra TaxID=112253 RepID=A0AA88U8V2_9ASTE|nr:hypothetical protein RJ640_008748 [Escallonia rubra]
MAATAITARSFVFFNLRSSFSFTKRLFSTSRLLLHAPPSRSLLSIITTASLAKTPFPKPFTTSSNPPKRSTLTNFSLPDSDSDTEESAKTPPTTTSKSKLPPPYDPFSKKPVIEEPDDPGNLQEVFHKIRTEGLTNNAVKMFDALSKDGLTHEALELFGQIKDKGSMPDVVAHTAVIEAYAKAGQAKEALKVFVRMLACGVAPNAYTYTVLIKGLAGSKDGKLVVEAKKYVVEMMGKGIRPNAGTYVAAMEGLVRAGKEEEARLMVAEMRARGFGPVEKAAMEPLGYIKGPIYHNIMNILFGK